MDTPLSPSQRGGVSLNRWLQDEPAAVRQTWRDQVIGTTREDLIAFGQRLSAMASDPAAIKVAVGSQAAFEKAEQEGTRFDVQQLA